MNIDIIKVEIDLYLKELENNIPTEINSCITKLATLSAIYARIGSMIPQLKMYVRKIKADRISTYTKIVKDTYLSAKIQDELMDGFAIEEVYLLELSQNIYSVCLVQMENCRTIISKEKEEMKLTGNIQ